MGMHIDVGILAYRLEHEAEILQEEAEMRQDGDMDENALGLIERTRQGYQSVNRVLQANGLPAHEEPEALPQFKSRSRGVGLPYVWLHQLRRAVAYALGGHKELPKLEASADPDADPIYDSVRFSSLSHVVCHSDFEGFYVPIDFPDPLYDDLPDQDERCLEGGILGSSQGAMRELVQVAPLLSISLRNGQLSDRQAEVLNLDDETAPFAPERYVWLKFFEATRLSIEYKTAIVFT